MTIPIHRTPWVWTGLWAVVCTIGSPSESHPELLKAAEQHCDKVVIMKAGQ